MPSPDQNQNELSTSLILNFVPEVASFDRFCFWMRTKLYWSMCFLCSECYVQINLIESTSSTLPFENQSNVRVLAASPDGRLLISVDEDGRALVINRRRRALLHHFKFKDKVRAAAFSPDGNYIAVAVGRLVQVWRRPGYEKSITPMELHRTYGQCHADVVAIEWSPDGCWIAAASKDLITRVFSLHPIEGYRPPILTGHKETPIAVHFTSKKLQEAASIMNKDPPYLYTISRDGALFGWTYFKDETPEELEGTEEDSDESSDESFDSGKVSDADNDDDENTQDKTVDGASSDNDDSKLENGRRNSKEKAIELSDKKNAFKIMQTETFAGGHWRLTDKYYFNQRGSKITTAAFHRGIGILAVGFSSGLFELLQLPEMSTIHTLSIGREKLTSMAFNPTGEWIAVGSAALGQLLVWEWRSESYVLKQQGHYAEVTTTAFSPDGAHLVTGADDSKVKVWSLTSGFCYVTFADHSAPITSVAFAPSGHAVISASLDGTVRAFDLVRYRNFRTLVTPEPVQFASLAIDPAGEIVVAGSQDNFQLYVWSLKTGRLLDVLAGHEGPVIGLSFAPSVPILASASWDATVRTWDVFSGKGGVEVLQHSHDVLAVAWRPDGKQLASSTLDGQIYFWDPIEGELQAILHGRRDIAGGRLRTDSRTSSNTSSGRAFTSLAYSADGTLLLAGGSSKYVCLYDVNERVMLRRFQITSNKSLDGVLDKLSSKLMTDAGPSNLINDKSSDDDEPSEILYKESSKLPGVSNGAYRIARTRHVSLSPTGRSWAAATSEGVLLYSLDQGLLFDPTDLAEDITPAAAIKYLNSGAYLRSLLIALRLKDPAIVRHVILSTPPKSVQAVAATLPGALLPNLLQILGEMFPETPHIEHLLGWVLALCARHGDAIKKRPVEAMPALRAIGKSLSTLQEDIGSIAESNLYTLRYLTSSGTNLNQEKRDWKSEEGDNRIGNEFDL